MTLPQTSFGLQDSSPCYSHSIGCASPHISLGRHLLVAPFFGRNRFQGSHVLGSYSRQNGCRGPRIGLADHDRLHAEKVSRTKCLRAVPSETGDPKSNLHCTLSTLRTDTPDGRRACRQDSARETSLRRLRRTTTEHEKRD